MALSAKSLFLYGLEVTDENSSLDFKTSMGGPERQATLETGFYSVTSLLIEIVRAMRAVDTSEDFIASANRSVAGGTQIRITISTSGSYLSFLFASGTRSASTCASLLGFTATDKTGSTSYTSGSTIGTALTPNLAGYNYNGPIGSNGDRSRKVFGNVNVSANGTKEAIVFQIQKFIEVQYKFIPEEDIPDWVGFLTWAIQQRPFDFTPEISNPTVYNEVTLESTPQDNKGLAFMMKEMLPQFPNLYDTGLLKFRIKE